AIAARAGSRGSGRAAGGVDSRSRRSRRGRSGQPSAVPPFSLEPETGTSQWERRKPRAVASLLARSIESSSSRRLGLEISSEGRKPRARNSATDGLPFGRGGGAFFTL